MLLILRTNVSFRLSPLNNRISEQRKFSRELLNSVSSEENPNNVFGSEFIQNKKIPFTGIDRNKVEKVDEFNKLRVQLLSDNLYFVLIGICITWGFGSLIDVFSFTVGGIMGVLYFALLGRYVEGLGENGGGSIRFVPVILLVLLYGKFKTELHFIPELIGFFTYKISPLLQIFQNEDES